MLLKIGSTLSRVIINKKDVLFQVACAAGLNYTEPSLMKQVVHYSNKNKKSGRMAVCMSHKILQIFETNPIFYKVIKSD